MTNRGRILVVDDTAATRYATARLLKAADFDVVEAATGAEALQRISEEIDLVLLDVQLPDIHGFELCRMIRKREGAELLPVIHLSATYKADTDRVGGLEAGADGYLTHPVEPIVLIATIRTVLRARRADEERRASDRRFREIFEEAPVGIALLDREGSLVEVNPGMSAICGRPAAEIVGRSLREFLTEEDCSELDKVLAVSEQQWGGSLPVRRPDGTLAVVDWRIAAAPESGLRLVLALDVTEQQRFHAEREDLLARERAARDEAERLNTQKDHFLAMLGHELRNPLAAIMTGVELLKNHTLKDGRREWVYEGLERQTAQLASLIDDLLDTNRISHGKLTLNRTAVDLQAAIGSAVDACRDLIREREHTLQVDDASGIFVDADPVRLEQIITNLLSNAAKYTPRGGSIQLQTSSEGDYAEISVVDSGVGLSEEDISRIFEAFAQVGDPGQGLGIGLTLVRQLVELHGGTIQAESQGLGRGSTFRVRLPVPQPEAAPAEAPASRDLALAGVRVLIVDDNKPAAAMLDTLLQERGYATRVALTGQGAIEAAKEFQPQLILLDVGLPDISGYEVAERLREAGFTSAVIAALSGYGPDQAEGRVREGVFDAQLIKPARAHQVDELISRLGGQTSASVKSTS